MKTFLNWFWNFVFCLKFHLPLLLPPWFWKISISLRFHWAWKSSPLLPLRRGGWGGRGSCYAMSSVVPSGKSQIYNQSKVTPLKDSGWNYELNWIKFWPWCWKQLDIFKQKQTIFSMKQLCHQRCRNEVNW